MDWNTDLARANQSPCTRIEKLYTYRLSVLTIADDDSPWFFDRVNRRIIAENQEKNIGFRIIACLHSAPPSNISRLCSSNTQSRLSCLLRPQQRGYVVTLSPSRLSNQNVK